MIQVKFTRAGHWFQSTRALAAAAFAKNYSNVEDCFAELENGLVVVTNVGSFRQSDDPAPQPAIIYTPEEIQPFA